MSQIDPGPARGSDEYLVGLERRIAQQRKEIGNLRQRLHDEGEGKEKANKRARRRIAHLERMIGQQAVSLDRQYHGLRALKYGVPVNSDARLSEAASPAWDGERCRDCGRGYAIVWIAPNDLWKSVWGNEGGTLCPDCFDERCRSAGIFVRFAVETL